jgi:hypothetical protein
MNSQTFLSEEESPGTQIFEKQAAPLVTNKLKAEG